MATYSYINGRKRYSRPQAVLWSENPGTLLNGLYVPTGQEIGADSTLTAGGEDQFLILSDHNRSEMSFAPERIEKRQRTINGRMRSYHIADKVNISTSWKYLTSRTSSDNLIIDQEDGSTFVAANATSYTSDFGAGGVDLLNWYENNKGSFWVYLAYDKFSNFETDKYNKMNRYNEIVEVFFDDFSYNVVSRGATTHDFWDISLSLEEV